MLQEDTVVVSSSLLPFVSSAIIQNLFAAGPVGEQMFIISTETDDNEDVHHSSVCRHWCPKAVGLRYECQECALHHLKALQIYDEGLSRVKVMTLCRGIHVRQGSTDVEKLNTVQQGCSVYGVSDPASVCHL